MRHLDQHLNLKTIFCSDIMLHSMPYNKVQVASWSRGTDFMPNLTFFISSIKSKMYATLKNRSRRMSWPRTLSYICISLHTHWCTFYTVSQKRIPNICSCNSSMCSWILITLGRNILYKHTHTQTHTHTHTHLFNGPLSRITRVSRYQKGITNLDFTEARDSSSGISWVICKQFAPHSSTPPNQFFYRPDALPDTQPTASKHWRHIIILYKVCNKMTDCMHPAINCVLSAKNYQNSTTFMRVRTKNIEDPF